MNKSEFISKIKTKYPSYKDVNDDVLYDKIITKYPQYKNQVTENKTDRITELKGISANAKQDYASAIKQKNEALPTFAKEAAGNIISGAEVAGGFTPASPAIMGVGEAARAGIEGKGIPEALKKGVMAAATDVAFMGAGKAITAGAGLAGRLGIQLAKKIPKPVMNQALKNPDLLLTPQKAVIDVGDDIIQVAKGLKSNADNIYANAIQNIQKKGSVATQGVRNAIKKTEGSVDTIASKMIGEAKKQGMDLSEEVVNKFFSGKYITFDEAKKMNSLLAATLRDLGKGATAELGGGMIGRLGAVKQANMKAMENVAPAIKNINREYAISREIADRTVRSLGTESSKKAVAEQLLGKITNKTKEARNLIRLEEKTGQPIIETFKNAMAREVFEKQAENAIMGYATPRSLIGAALGFGAGGGLGAGIGATAMNLLPHALTPGMIGRGIKVAPGIPGLLRNVTTPTRIGGEQMMLNQGRNPLNY